MSVMTVGDLPAGRPIPRPRLQLRACPVTLARLAVLAELLPVAGSPAREFVPAVALAFTMITGGASAEPDPALPCGTWILCADGRELARGTVIL